MPPAAPNAAMSNDKAPGQGAQLKATKDTIGKVGKWNAVRTDVLVREFVGQPDPLRLVLDGLAVNNGSLELLDNAAVDGIALLTSVLVSASSRPIPKKENRGLKGAGSEARLTKSSTVHFVERSTTGAE